MKKEMFPPRYQRFTIIAQDPAVKLGGKIIRQQVSVPAEIVAEGPLGHRVQVVDYDSSTGNLYKPIAYKVHKNKTVEDPFEHASDDALLSLPQFHAQNAYAIVMRILSRFEFAFGRRVGWSFNSHQLKVVPHAFADANAFYSKRDEGLLFGYFPGRSGGTIFSCLSHDVVAHETTHALVDGLRERYTDPSSPDQAGFHEGFADVVALLSVFALPNVVRVVLNLDLSPGNEQYAPSRRISQKFLRPESIKNSVLLGLAEEMGSDLSNARGQALRRSVELPPSKTHLEKEEFQEPHQRGEVLVAAIMNTFVHVWTKRLEELRHDRLRSVDRDRVAEEGALVADRLLTMAIRALDYCPPVHITFGDFLSALLTADFEIRPDDSTYKFRKHLLAQCGAYGIEPTSRHNAPEFGMWEPPGEETGGEHLNYSRVHFESMQRDPDEVFRFLWENRKALGLYEGAYPRVQSVRPCLRIAEDGFALQETVADYVQMLQVKPGELKRLKIEMPKGMDPQSEIMLYGGGVLVFDEYGKLKFHVRNRIVPGKGGKDFQGPRLKYLLEHGYLGPATQYERGRRFSRLHRMRSLNLQQNHKEGWI